MKKKLLTIFGVLCAAALCTAAFTACDDGGSTETPEDPTAYTVTFEDTEAYTLTVKNGYADDADIISSGSAVEAGDYVYVTAESKDYSKYINNVYYNDSTCRTHTTGAYYFQMPEQNVTITADTTDYEEVRSDSRASFTSTDTTIIKNGRNSGLITAKIWEFTISLDWTQPGNLSSSSGVTSSDQSVIPDSAITLTGGVSYEESVAGTGTATITIDTSLVEVGYTYLTIHLQNESSASSNTSDLCVCIEVTDSLELETWTETLTIDFDEFFDGENISEGTSVTVRLSDTDYSTGTTINGQPVTQAYTDYVCTVSDEGTISITFDYAVGHSYNVSVCLGEEYADSRENPEKFLSLMSKTESYIAEYTNYELSFYVASQTLELTVSGYTYSN